MAKLTTLIHTLRETGAALTEYLVLLALMFGGIVAIIGPFSDAVGAGFLGWTPPAADSLPTP